MYLRIIECSWLTIGNRTSYLTTQHSCNTLWSSRSLLQFHQWNSSLLIPSLTLIGLIDNFIDKSNILTNNKEWCAVSFIFCFWNITGNLFLIGNVIRCQFNIVNLIFSDRQWICFAFFSCLVFHIKRLHYTTIHNVICVFVIWHTKQATIFCLLYK